MIAKKLLQKSMESDSGSNCCPSCSQSSFIYDPQRGDQICSNCGLVVGEHEIDFIGASQHLQFSKKINKNVHSGPFLYILNPINQFSTHVNLHEIESQRLKRVFKKHNHLQWNERNILTAINWIKTIGNILNLPIYVLESCSLLYRKLHKMGHLRYSPIKESVISIIYITCRIEHFPIRFKEILDIPDGDLKHAKTIFKNINIKVNLKIPNIDLFSYIPRYGNELHLNSQAMLMTKNLLNFYMKKTKNVCLNPFGILAACLYLAGIKLEQPVAQMKIATLMDISEITLRSRYKELLILIKPKIKINRDSKQLVKNLA